MAIIGGINLGNLPDYLLFYSNGNEDANWQGATKGFIGDVAVNGTLASLRTSGSVPYAGTLYTNAATQGAWQSILNQNPTQSSGVTNSTTLISDLTQDLVSAIQQINALPVTPGFESRSSASLDGLNTQNGINEVFVINITSGLNFSNQINITGDAGDVYILRWDTDGNPANGYQGQLNPQSGGAIVPHGGLKPTNFINVAGDIGSSGGGTNPPPPYPQGPRFNDGQGSLIINGSDFAGGGFFTGYLLTTGSPDTLDPATGLYYGGTSSLSNGIFVGGWYSITTRFSMTSGTSGVYVSPNPETLDTLAIDVEKEVSPDNGVTWFDADTPPGPNIFIGTNPRFRITVTNTGDVTLTNVIVTDDVLGPIGTVPSLAPGASNQWIVTGTWALGNHINTTTATGNYNGETVTDSDPAYWVGVEAPSPAISILKEVSPNNGATWFNADTPPGPNVVQGTNPRFRITVSNAGNVTLTNVVVTDDVLGPIGTIPSLAPGASNQWIATGTWALGQHVNTATATANYLSQTLTASNPANWVGVEAPAPAISILKEVSPDSGVTWFDADTPPGPNVVQGTNPQFRITVSNTGNVAITNVVVTDNVLGPIGTVPSLAPGASNQWIVTGTWALGQHVNTATATANYLSQTLTASNPANWVGVAAPAPAISILKEVSPDGGVTWSDADTPPGPNVMEGINPQFRFTVTNTGNVALTNVVVTDDVLGLIGTVPSLATGASNQWVFTGTWALGQQVNTATATGNYLSQTLTASNPANWVGVEAPAPTIRILKEVSPDNGVTWFDADTPPGPNVVSGTNPQFRITITNTGNVALTNVVVTDDVLGPIGTVPSLAPGVSNQWTVTGTWALGQHVNTATATANYLSQTLTASNPANWVGVEAPSPVISVLKEVSPDSGATWFDANTPPGPNVVEGTNPRFRITVANTGNVALTNVVVTDDVLGPIGTLPSLAPGVSNQWSVTGTWALGQHVNTATATADYLGQTLTASNPANWVGVEAPAPAIAIIKEVSPDNGVTWFNANTPPGPNVISGTNPQFRFTVSNTGNVALTNVVVTDVVLGLIGTVPSLEPGASNQWIATGTWALGQHVNTATVTGNYLGQTLTASDPAYWVGVNALIDIQKYISVDNGVTWIDADTPPGPLLPSGITPRFRFVVSNNGSVSLTNIQVTDNVLGLIGTLPILNPGESFEWIING